EAAGGAPGHRGPDGAGHGTGRVQVRGVGREGHREVVQERGGGSAQQTHPHLTHRQ
ncbi:hypothetical protein HGM15179_022175, partial [Zosterops borbonicus]